jgi:hypothetical protein
MTIQLIETPGLVNLQKESAGNDAGIMLSRSDALAQEHELRRPSLLPCRPSLIPVDDFVSHIHTSPALHLFSSAVIRSGVVSVGAHPALKEAIVNTTLAYRIVLSNLCMFILNPFPSL